MAKTLSQVLGDINESLPNVFPTTSLINFINDAVRKYWTNMTDTTTYEFQLSSGQAIYTLPTNCDISQIVEHGVLVSDATAAPTSSAIWEPYEFKGLDEDLDGSNYYEANGELGLYPVADNGYYARIEYQEYPIIMQTSDMNTQFNLDQDYIDLITNDVCSKVAKKGKFPRVDLANNYTMDAQEIKKSLRMQQAKEKVKTNRTRYNWQDWRR